MSNGPKVFMVENPGGWSGLVLYATGTGSFGSVEATWTVPNIGVPTFAKGLLESSDVWAGLSGKMAIATWVGFDSGGRPGGRIPLWQGGFTTHSTLQSFEEGIAPHSYAWWEITPSNIPGLGQQWPYLIGDTQPLNTKHARIISSSNHYRQNLNNFPVSPGDTVSVKIEKADPSDGWRPALAIVGAATFTYTNFTQSVTTSVTLGSTYQLWGGNVEWIVENPAVGASPPGPIMPAYGAVYFDQAQCTFGKGTLAPGPVMQGKWKPSDFPTTVLLTDPAFYVKNWINYTQGPQGNVSKTTLPGCLTLSSPFVIAPDLLRCASVNP
jgi:hypothetical protein